MHASSLAGASYAIVSALRAGVLVLVVGGTARRMLELSRTASGPVNIGLPQPWEGRPFSVWENLLASCEISQSRFDSSCLGFCGEQDCVAW